MNKIHQPPQSTPTRSVLTVRGVVRKAMQPPAAPAALSDSEYFYVWSPSRRRPRSRHATRALAEAEGARLAALCPGVRFDVFHAVKVAGYLK